MWPFTSKHALQPSGYFRDLTDWHCHILPGVDDGFRSMEDSLAALSFYADIGINEVWLTPHIMEDIPNTPEELKARFAELCAVYKGPLKLHLAAEHMMDKLFQERFASGDVLPIGSRGDTLLVETSYFSPPMDMDGILRRIQREGLRPLLAHPERYVYMGMNDYRRLHDNGIDMQLNLMSLTGHYGPDARAKALRLLKEGFYSRVGTDLHRLRPFQHAIGLKCLTHQQIALIPKYSEFQ